MSLFSKNKIISQYSIFSIVNFYLKFKKIILLEISVFYKVFVSPWNLDIFDLRFIYLLNFNLSAIYFNKLEKSLSLSVL